jgi:hypothetical protein
MNQAQWIQRGLGIPDYRTPPGVRSPRPGSRSPSALLRLAHLDSQLCDTGRVDKTAYWSQ